MLKRRRKMLAKLKLERIGEIDEIKKLKQKKD